MKIAVAGTGYVGLSLATLLAQHNEKQRFVLVLDELTKSFPRFRTIILKNIWQRRS